MAAQHSMGTESTVAYTLGIVLAVDRPAGVLTLWHADGRSAKLTADPGLLGEVRIGGPVKVVVEGTTVRSLRRL